MFVWRASAILAEIERHLPAHAAALRAIGKALGTTAFPGIFAVEYAKMPKISIDFGVMEKASEVRVVKADFGWDDVGSWAAAAAHRAADADGNVVEALSAAVDTRGAVVISTDDGHLIATLGVRDLVIVHTRDATLVCPKDRTEELKALIDAIRAKGLDRLL
jgi:mannose-1-phosphate guanylyltransferase